MITKLLFLIPIMSAGCTAAFASLPELLRTERIRHTIRIPFGESLGLSVVETRQSNGMNYRLFYSNSSNHLQAIEKRDVSTGDLIAFRHRYLINGQELWSDWLPPSLRKSGSFPWPDLDRPDSNELGRLEPLSALEESGLSRQRELEEQERTHRIFSSRKAALEKPGFSWEPGDYSWSYDPAKMKIWAGYLWDFKNGWLFRGYRKSVQPDEILTPSQNQTSSKPEEVKQFYTSMTAGIASAYNADNSRWLSPLDKWGFWAERRFGQQWRLASSWEAVNHHTNVEWGGYCNASTVLPFLWRKPLHGVVDQELMFDPRDLVGLMQVASYRVDLLFWGARFNGNVGDEITEPSPELAVRLLYEYLGKNGTPIIFDHEAGPAIGNVLAVAARLHIEKTDDPKVRKAVLEIDNTGNMEDDLAVGRKDEEALVPEWSWGTDTKKYEFTIHLRDDGSLHWMRWEKPDFHPDFFWLPVANNDYSAPHRKNPYLPMQYVRELVEKSYK